MCVCVCVCVCILCVLVYVCVYLCKYVCMYVCMYVCVCVYVRMYVFGNGLSNVYCGMNYTGLSCEHIYNKNRETSNKNGYYPININQLTICNLTALQLVILLFLCWCGKKVLILVLEVSVPLDGTKAL